MEFIQGFFCGGCWVLILWVLCERGDKGGMRYA